MSMRIFPYILSTPCHLATGAEIRPWERGCGKAGNCCTLNNNIVYYTPVQGVYSYAITFHSVMLVGSIIFFKYFFIHKTNLIWGHMGVGTTNFGGTEQRL